MTDPYWAWRDSGGLRPDEVPEPAPEPAFAVSAHSVEIEPAQLPRSAHTFYKRMLAADYEIETRMNLTRHKPVLYVGTDKAGQVKTAEKIVEHFGVQAVKWMPDGDVGIALQAHWGDGFEGAYFYTSVTGREFLLTATDLNGIVDIIAPKPQPKTRVVKEAA